MTAALARRLLVLASAGFAGGGARLLGYLLGREMPRATATVPPNTERDLRTW